MRSSRTALAGCIALIFPLAPGPLAAQIPDTAAMLQRVQEELESGRLSPEEVRARIRAAGISDQEIRRRLREAGYPESLLDRYLGEGIAATATPSLTSGQIETVLRRLSIPALGELGLADSLLLGDTSPAPLPPPEGTGPPIFGRNLFARATTQFRALTAGPVPPNYRLGPGDELVLILTGDVQEIYTLPVTREGFIVVPNLGRVSVNGLTLEGLREALYTYLGRVYSGVRRGPEATTFFEVSIGSLRRNQIFVIGEVERPAAYEVTSVATVLEALYQAGGPSEQGSFRNIEIRRGDRMETRLDIYEYLTTGRAEGDIPLDQGDVVFVPVRGRRVTIDGNVVRPGIYELKPDEGLRAALALAGGVEPAADLRRVQIDRVLPPEQRRPGVMRTLFDVNVAALADSEGEMVPLEAGDRVYVFAVSDERRNLLVIRGNVWAPGMYERVPGMRLSELIDRAGGLKDDTYRGRVQIIRLDPVDLSRRVVPVSLVAGAEDPELQEYDEVVIYSVSQFRDRRFVTIYGAVQNPGVYEFREDMTLRDLVLMAGGLRDDAYVLEAEVARISAMPDATGDLTELRIVPLDSTYVVEDPVDRAGSSGGNGQTAAPEVELERYDNVFIRSRPGFELQRTVTLTGEVEFPGVYALERKDDRLASVIGRAGGLTPDAYAAGIRFYRTEQVGANRPETRSRVNVDLPAALADSTDRENLILVEGDSIHVPEYISTVRVEGAVLFPSTVMYDPGEGLDYYIQGAGGYARDGDKGRARVEYANGTVRTVSKFLIFKSKPRPGPGSRVFVPAKPPGEPINWAAVTAVITTTVTVYALLFK